MGVKTPVLTAQHGDNHAHGGEVFKTSRSTRLFKAQPRKSLHEAPSLHKTFKNFMEL